MSNLYYVDPKNIIELILGWYVYKKLNICYVPVWSYYKLAEKINTI